MQITSLWNKEGISVPAIEGKQLELDLRPYFIRPHTGSVSFSADIGKIEDTIWKWTPPYGSIDTTLALVSATFDTQLSQLRINLTITAADTIKPVITLVDSTLDGKTVSSPQLTITCIAKDNKAGIDNVTITCGTAVTTAVLQSDTTYSGVVSGLQNGIPTAITITAFDKSMMKNRGICTFTVTYDSTASGVAPAITTPLPVTVQVIEGETLTLQVVASGTPLPTFRWYKDEKLQEGQHTAEFSKNNAVPGDSGSYHVVVSNGIGTPVTSTKTAVSIRLKAKIMQHPVGATVKEGENGSFSVTADGEGPLSYQWYKNGELLTDAANSEYSITNADTTDNGKGFICIVSNAFSKDTSTAGILTVIKKPVYQVSFVTGEGSIAPEMQQIPEGGKISPPAAPTRNGYDFSGWYKEAEATNEWDFAIDIVNGPVTLYAMWIEKRYTVTYYANGGTSGNAPKDSKTYTSGSLATALPNSGKLMKNGESFRGWSRSADGSGTWISCGQSIYITNNESLYAQYSSEYVMDNDGNLYSVITIGGKTWLSENLGSTKYNNGDPIPYVEDEGAWMSLSIGAYCWYGNDSSNKAYGALYNGFAVNTGNLAPAGWHVATKADWQLLIDSLGSGGNLACKMINNWATGWANPPECDNNHSAFSAIGNGCRACKGIFGIFYEQPVFSGFTGSKEGATWWTSTEYLMGSVVPGTGGYYYYLDPIYGLSDWWFTEYKIGFGVRCVKDE